jgi:hypothetical protein
MQDLSTAMKPLLDKQMKKLDIELIEENAQTFHCKVCYMDVDMKDIKYLYCGHYFC